MLVTGRSVGLQRRTGGLLLPLLRLHGPQVSSRSHPSHLLVSSSPHSSTVLRCPRGDTALITLGGRHSDCSAVLPQHDQ
ncbi:hypothetical protein EYF80_053841 [Liparis tanakae]|uniref:Uncharacterized protein n=1 Tax=Liparis tanakae TaxID=230148 RepID=A0A4Z2F6B5_9TELE|nr:hypothetical protein EYF80_053841 [Liparis tanakae]